MQKQKQLKLVCQIFHFTYKIQKISLLRVVLKRLKLPNFLMVWHERFQLTRMGVEIGAEL